jgi:hypothetical protein
MAGPLTSPLFEDGMKQVSVMKTSVEVFKGKRMNYLRLFHGD